MKPVDLVSPRRLAPACAVLLLVLVVTAFGDGPRGEDPPAQEPESPSSSLVERVEVHLAAYDVVVRDGDGRPVSGLGAEDFVVTDNGVPVEVVAVEEWGAPAQAAPAEQPPAPPEPQAPATEEPAPEPAETGPRTEPRSIVLLFDNMNTTSALRLTQAKRAARRWVESSLQPDDVVAVFQLDMALRPLCGFTSSASILQDAIDRVVWMPDSTFADQVAESVLAYRSRGSVPRMDSRLQRGAILESQVLDWRREHFYKNLEALSGAFEGLPGRRALVLVSAGFPMTTAGDFERLQGGFTLGFRDLIRALGWAGVAVYSIDIGEASGVGDASRPIDWRIAVGKLGMEESVLSDLGLDKELSSGSAIARRQVLGVLAGETGGRLLTQSDFNRAFEVIQEETTRFYKLFCKVPRRDETRYSRLLIRTREPGLKVTARAGRYGDVLPRGRDVVGSGGKEVLSDLSRFRTVSLRGGSLILPDHEGANSRVVVVVEALGPMEFPLEPGGAARVDLDFYLVARQADDVVARFSRTLNAGVRAEGAGAIRDAFRVEGSLDLPPGRYDLQANLRINDPPQFGSWTRAVVVPEEPEAEAGLRFEGLILAPGDTAVSPLLISDENKTGTDRLSLGEGMRLLPPTHWGVEAGSPLIVMFWLAGLPAEEGKPPKVDFSVRVEDADGAAVTPAVRVLMFRPDGAGGHRGLLQIEPGSLPAGGYLLKLAATTPDGLAAATVAPFQIQGGGPPIAEAPETPPAAS